MELERSKWHKKVALLVIITGIVACGDIDPLLLKKDRSKSQDLGAYQLYSKLTLNTETFEGCDELQEYAHKQLVKKLAYDLYEMEKWKTSNDSNTAYSSPADTSAQSESSSSAPKAQDSFTNRQESKIDEGDYVKIAPHHILAVEESLLQVSDRQNLKYIGSIDLKGLSQINLYVENHNLIVIGTEWATNGINSKTKVKVYKLKAGKLPLLVSETSTPGSYQQHRLRGKHLILTFVEQLYYEYPSIYMQDANVNPKTAIAKRPLKLDAEGTLNSVECTRFTKPQIEDFDFGVTRVLSIDIDDKNLKTHALAFLGSSSGHAYMTENALYLTKAGANLQPLDEDSTNPFLQEQLVVSKIKVLEETGELHFVAVGAAPGRIKDQWAIKEYPNGVLSVATSTGILFESLDSANVAQNHLTLLHENSAKRRLEVLSAISNFGTGEDIRSVRYIDTMAYVVTFKKTDPLFAFDLSNPEKPLALGELKIPGFSLYMHPIENKQMVGVGYDAEDQGDFAFFQGVQVSLFDVSDPKNLQRTDVKVHGARGSYTEVNSDHHAFFYDRESSLMALPLVEIDEINGGAGSFGAGLKYSGAVIYDLSSGKLSESGRVSHQDWIPKSCQAELAMGQWWQSSHKSRDINRIYKIDGSIFTISAYGIKVYDSSDFKNPTKEIKFKLKESECENHSYYRY
ncbi:MAG: beta-propeller domain-containing protein [Oligoflexales bacterium]|nr:beta-propeller domain-containing protein [Oligoflexales bacterium]